jgi:hypothetical protein
MHGLQLILDLQVLLLPRASLILLCPPLTLPLVKITQRSVCKPVSITYTVKITFEFLKRLLKDELRLDLHKIVDRRYYAIFESTTVVRGIFEPGIEIQDKVTAIFTHLYYKHFYRQQPHLANVTIMLE